MTPMCSTESGELVGWSTANVSCDGSTITISYFDTDGLLVGATLPGGWSICRPSFASNMVNTIVSITQVDYDALVDKDPNTLYIII